MSYNDYKQIKKLGQGGNGYVYLVKNSLEEEFALKRLKIKKAKKNYEKTRIERFKTEAIKTNQLYKEGQKGIVPVIHYELPCEDTGFYYFTMPKAIPLEEKIFGNKDIYELVYIFKDLASTLKELHDKNITHRDIKPENILYYNGSYCFGDFGLIDFPEKEDLTRVKESLGNRKTMAPEMRIPIDVDDQKPADVYSFAKTLWIVLTGEEFAFDGQFNYFENNKLQQRFPEQHFVELNKLLKNATAENPLKRPTIGQFLDRLIEWEKIAKDRGLSSRSLWRFIEENVTYQFQPTTAMWRNEDQVVEILQKLSSINFNHTFLSDTGGGMDIRRIVKADWVKENNLLGIDDGSFFFRLCKLKRLVFEIPNNDSRFSYFRLEFDELGSIFCDECDKEYLIVNKEGEYEPYFEDGNIQVARYRKGVFLIVHKSSIYNLIGETYDARHSKMSTDEFREYMEILQIIYNHPILNEYFYGIASLDPSEGTNFKDIKDLIEMNDEELLNHLE
ncbi:protein kinase [Lysinibacillus capsici]|uniref:protein kinase domain-containing protein n=1 Tax=Lysinibacillus capsici TaxID=2115968 RepID=UPI0032E50180